MSYEENFYIPLSDERMKFLVWKSLVENIIGI